MDRRAFLKAAGITAALSGPALARRLILLDSSASARITRIEWIVYETGLSAPGGDPTRRCAVRITTASGVQGWADVPASAAPGGEAFELVRNVLLQHDANDLAAIWRELFEQGIPLKTLAAVDVALWDLRGRLANKPVHALLGTRRQQAKAYLTTPFNLGSAEFYAERALAAKKAGLHGCKVRPYIEWGSGPSGRLNRGFPDRDMAAYQAVRDAVGADYPCMADNHGTYSYDEALRVGRLLDDLEYAWYESPMPESEDWRDRYAALVRQLKTPVCAPEAHPGSYAPRLAWIESGACDISRINVLAGGFTACLELAVACEAAGVSLELHNTGADAYPHLQLIGTTDESLIGHVELHSLARDTSPLPGRKTPESVFDDDGLVAVPGTPGMGLELDWTYILTHRVA